MKRFVIAGTLAGAVALSGIAFAQQTAPTTPAPKMADQPATPKKAATKKSAEGSGTTQGAHTTPNQQPNTADEAKSSDQSMTLGTVHIPMGVKADGKDLPAGTYTVKLTTDAAKPDAKGATQTLERWAEFTKGGKVAGRELVTIIPPTEKQLVVKDTAPPVGGSKVQTLRGGEYLRVWFNKAGTQYLVHLPKA
jgi:hypothetical protein